MGRLSESDRFQEWLRSSPPDTREAMEALQGVVASDRCVMFSTTWCPWCTRAQDFVKDYTGGKSCRKVDLDAPPPELAKVGMAASTLAALTGQNSIPNLFIARKHIGGYQQLVNAAERCRSGEIAQEHGDICEFLRPAQGQASAQR
mmetsp:Transcript_114154/g.209748  ORF Transcript_114154/g.209748 Transcript_114154/m.209748 type:complete len:146 (-) Transcript_114154:107-544(-)